MHFILKVYHLWERAYNFLKISEAVDEVIGKKKKKKRKELIACVCNLIKIFCYYSCSAVFL